MTFADDITRFADKTRMRSDRTVRAIIAQFMTELVMMTPVDTGMARSNWFFGIKPARETSEEHDNAGSPTMRRMGSFVSSFKTGGSFYISNNLPYIMKLEFDGWSKQAPAGMARITCARWQRIVNEAVRMTR